MQTVINGNLVFYQKIGKSKNTLLILHGWGRNHKDWLETAKFLSTKYTVYILDLPGFGNSKLKNNTNLDTYQYADIIYEFIQKQNIKNIILLGHSFGGKISIVLSSKHPELISKLILVDNSGLEQKTLKTSLKIFLAKIFKFSPIPKNIKNKLRNRLASNDYRYAGNLRETFKNIVNQNLDTEAKNLDTKTLIIWGDRDQEVPVKWALKEKSLIKNSTLRIVYGAAHHPHLEKPEDFKAILEEYI